MNNKKIICGSGMVSISLLCIGFLCLINNWANSVKWLAAGLLGLLFFVNYLGVYLYYKLK